MRCLSVWWTSTPLTTYPWMSGRGCVSPRLSEERVRILSSTAFCHPPHHDVRALYSTCVVLPRTHPHTTLPSQTPQGTQPCFLLLAETLGYVVCSTPPASPTQPNSPYAVEGALVPISPRAMNNVRSLKERGVAPPPCPSACPACCRAMKGCAGQATWCGMNGGSPQPAHIDPC